MSRRGLEPSPSGVLPYLLVVVLGATGTVARAEVTVQPSVSARTTYTDNASLSSGGGDEFIVEVTPAIRLQRSGGRLNGGLNAALRNVRYANESSKDSTFITFRGNGQYEAVDDTLFLEASGSVSRNDRSLFSARSESDPQNTDSSNETRTFVLSPRLHFRLGGAAQGVLRYQSVWSGGNGVESDRRIGSWDLSLNEQDALGPFGWFANYNTTTTEYQDDVRDVSSSVGRVGLSYRLTPRFVVRGSVGRESNDFSVEGTRYYTTHGVGFDWTPTPRTSFSAFTEERMFGRGYDVSLRHRARRSAWTMVYSRDYTSSTSLIQTSVEDYYYDLLYQSLSSIEDEALRDAATRALLAALGLEGVSGQVNFVSNTQTVRETLRGTMVLTGIRNTLTVSLYRTENERISPDLIISGLDDFAGTNFIKTQGGLVSLAHRISGKSSANVSLSRTETEGQGTTDRSQTNTDLVLGLTRRLGAHSTGGLNYVRSWRSGDVAGDENRLSASFSIRF